MHRQIQFMIVESLTLRPLKSKFILQCPHSLVWFSQRVLKLRICFPIQKLRISRILHESFYLASEEIMLKSLLKIDMFESKQTWTRRLKTDLKTDIIFWQARKNYAHCEFSWLETLLFYLFKDKLLSYFKLMPWIIFRFLV